MGTFAPFTAETAAQAVRDELLGDDELFALRMVIEAVADLRAILGCEHSPERATRLDAFLAPPAGTGSLRWDTLLAAAIGRELRRNGVPRPGWAIPDPLPSWWFVCPNPVLTARTMQRTPPDLACVGIWLDEAAFHSA